MALGGIVLIAAVLNTVGLNTEGYANTYYAAAVKSMLLSWHNLFFVSFDPGGFVAVDKPPLGLWIQAASAKIFGFSGVSLLLPQAIAGVISVVVLYALIARVSGRPAGLVAAFALAVTPIAVVDNRNNSPDSLLILSLLLATWAVTRAAETERLGALLAGAALVGLGFNIKGLEAYLAVPALVALYLALSRERAVRRVWRLLLACAVLVAVSFAWVAAVDLTPAGQRPYVSDSGTNSELSLTIGYNGLGRLAAGILAGAPPMPLLGGKIDVGVTPAPSQGIGSPSLLRLAQPGLASQVGWLLPIAVIGLAAVALESRRRGWSRRTSHAVSWSIWVLTVGGFFSVASFFHLYYLILLAPAVAALAGIGVWALWELYRDSLTRWRVAPWQPFLLPLALVATAAVQLYILAWYESWAGLIAAVTLSGAAVALVGLCGGRLRTSPRARPASLRPPAIACAVGILALSLTPVVFSAESVVNGNGAAWLPQAGPQTDAGPVPRVSAAPAPLHVLSSARHSGGSGRVFGNFLYRLPLGMRGVLPARHPARPVRATPPVVAIGGAMTFDGTNAPRISPTFLAYLLRNRGHARYILATTTSAYASVFILAAGEPVMALGGYQGWDRILTLPQLRGLVAADTVRFFLVPSSVAGDGPWHAVPASGNLNPNDTNAGLVTWITRACHAVPTAVYLSATPSAARGTAVPAWLGANRLYDCAHAG